MLSFLMCLLAAVQARAIIMEPTYQSAEALGYQVVGELEFQNESFQIAHAEFHKQIAEIGELCPRTQAAVDPRISSFTKFVILAWSDNDFPTPRHGFHSAHQRWLAQKRARVVAQRIRHNLRGPADFELVNMATRQPHLVDAHDPETQNRSRVDVKKILETNGGAPSDPLGYGLFAEYSQAAKAVIWVDCRDSLIRRRGPSNSLVQLAALGRLAR